MGFRSWFWKIFLKDDQHLMNNKYRKLLPNTELDYFDSEAAVNDIQTGAYA